MDNSPEETIAKILNLLRELRSKERAPYSFRIAELYRLIDQHDLDSLKENTNV